MADYKLVDKDTLEQIEKKRSPIKREVLVQRQNELTHQISTLTKELNDIVDLLSTMDSMKVGDEVSK